MWGRRIAGAADIETLIIWELKACDAVSSHYCVMMNLPLGEKHKDISVMNEVKLGGKWTKPAERKVEKVSISGIVPKAFYSVIIINAYLIYLFIFNHWLILLTYSLHLSFWLPPFVVTTNLPILLCVSMLHKFMSVLPVWNRHCQMLFLEHLSTIVTGTKIMCLMG